MSFCSWGNGCFSSTFHLLRVIFLIHKKIKTCLNMPFVYLLLNWLNFYCIVFVELNVYTMSLAALM